MEQEQITRTISQNLKGAGFIICKREGKEPSIKKGQDWNNKIISFEEANKKIREGYNIGLVSGINSFITIDCDELELAQAVIGLLPQTYQEASISGGMHFIFQCFDDIDNKPIKWNNKHLGEIRVKRQYVVIAPSKAINKKGELKEYEILNDCTPAIITKDEVNNLIKQFEDNLINQKKSSLKLSNNIIEQINSDLELKRLFDGDITGFPSRSEAEQSLVCKLISRGFDKETIFSIMANTSLDKWNEKPLSYRNITYNKAVALITTEKKEWKDGKNIQQENIGKVFLKDWDYFIKKRKDKTKKPKDLVQKLTPYKSLSLLYGSPKCGKSMLELYKCFCLSRGKLFGNLKTIKTNCLYIDRENNEDIISERELALKKFLKIRKHNVYFLTRENDVDIHDEMFKAKIEQVIQEKNIGYIVFDTLPKCAYYNSLGEDDINRIYTSVLMPLIEKYCISITYLLHTTKKGDSFIGSQAYKGISDCVYELDKVSDIDNIVKSELISDNRRANINFGIRFSFFIKKDKEDYEHLNGINIEFYETTNNRRAGNPKKKKSYDNKKLTKDIISLFDSEDKQLKKSDVVDGLKSIGYTDDELLSSDSSIKRTLEWMSKTEEDKGAWILLQEGEGKGTTYRLSKKGINMLNKRKENI